VLLNLTGAVQFDALVNITSFNDNENVFASQHVFECWMKEPLSSLGGVFNNAFLQGLDDPTEPLGAPGIENGWFFIDGLSASSSACSTADPAILGLLIEGIGASRSATLPFASVETQTNGSLVEFSILTPGCEQFVANNDSFNMCANPSTAEAIDILINDVGSIDCESITITDNPDHGLISVLADCGLPFCPLTCLGYQPAPGFVGEDTFTYQVTSAVNPGITDQATVTIRVRQVVANNDTATTIQGTPIIIGVTANDSASPPLTLDCSSLVILVPPSNGTVQPVACGGLPGPCPAACVRYTPNANFTGTDSFVYGIGAGECTDTATVALTVLPAAPPKASQR
jgi:hypothetical protein